MIQNAKVRTKAGSKMLLAFSPFSEYTVIRGKVIAA